MISKLKKIAVFAAVIGVLLVYTTINPSEVDFLPKCPLYTITGFYCPGCGSQRATHQLLNFNFYGVLQQNLLYFLALFIGLYQLFISIAEKVFGKSYNNLLNHPKTPVIVLIVVLLFWVLRNIPYYPFDWLAPN